MRIVSSRASPSYPRAITETTSGVKSTPIRTMSEMKSARIVANTPATRPASSSFPSASSFAYTGMKDAERTPSPKRFCNEFGMRSAAMNAPVAIEFPK